MSKHVGENCGKLCISCILSSKRGITPSKLDGNRRHSKLDRMYITRKYHAKFQLNTSKHDGEKCGKL